MKHFGPVPLSEALFLRHVLAHIALVGIVDAGGRIIFTNRKFCETSGRTRNELIGASHRILCADIRGGGCFTKIYRCVARGEVWQGEICIRPEGGTPRWIDAMVIPDAGRAGSRDTYTLIGFDITAQRATEEILRQIAGAR